MSEASEVIDVEPERSVATIEKPARSAAWSLAEMTDEAFERQMVMLKVGRDRLQKVMKSMMAVDVHYGKIPGTDKDTLLQPGADMLLKMFNLVAEPLTEIEYGDGFTAPAITVKARCLVHANQIDGPVVAVGEAAATSWEKKWRYRQQERTCPECGKQAIIKGKVDYGGGWLCWKKKDGCGYKFVDGDERIESQQAGQIENPDQFDLLNTIVKIANKRAKVHGTIAATDSSDLLTQDMEEQQPEPIKIVKPEPQKAQLLEPVIVGNWSSFLHGDPTLPALNEKLKELASVPKGTETSKALWKLISDFATKAELQYNPELKAFEQVTPWG